MRDVFSLDHQVTLKNKQRDSLVACPNITEMTSI